MSAKLIIRVTPDDRVQVKVEGLAATDATRPRGDKLCEKLTRRLEADLGGVEQRIYETAQPVAEALSEAEPLRVGDC